MLRLRPTAIVGVSTVGGAFTRAVIENMSSVNERPIIFPYSNPTSRSECTAEQAYTWSKGKAIFASGSPFAPVTYKGRTFTPGQGNNVFIFPAMGLAILATEAKRVTDEMFITAAEAVAEQITEEDFARGLIYPAVKDIRQVSVNVAVKVAETIFDSEPGRREEAAEPPEVPRAEDVPTRLQMTAGRGPMSPATATSTAGEARARLPLPGPAGRHGGGGRGGGPTMGASRAPVARVPGSIVWFDSGASR